MQSNEYQCANCDGIFIKGWSDEEQDAEFSTNFPGIRQQDAVVICDDCYIKVTSWKSPSQFMAEENSYYSQSKSKI